MPFILTSFASLAKIEQWDKENLARHLLSRCPSFTYTQNIGLLTGKNKASAVLGLAFFMCFLAVDSVE